MNQLWAPWRMELIEKDKAGPAGACIFCDLPRAADDRENLILGRTRHTFAILNRFPYNNGHLMVVPRAHTADLLSLSYPLSVNCLTNISFDIFLGCRKRFTEDCTSLYNNTTNFLGFPWIPIQETAF